MRFILAAILALFFTSCIDSYNDSVQINRDGSATFNARVSFYELDSNLISSTKENYDSVAGLKLDSIWLVQKDSIYSLNLKFSFENLLTWQSNKKFEEDFGVISLKKIDSIPNGYSFERILNPGIETGDSTVVPEEAMSEFILNQISKNGTIFWEYSLILPKEAALLNFEPTDETFVKQIENPNILNWKISANDAISKRLSLKANFSLPQKAKDMELSSFLGIAAGVFVMLLAIAMLVRKLKRLGFALKKLKEEENNIKE